MFARDDQLDRIPKLANDAAWPLEWGRHSCLPVGRLSSRPEARLESPANRRARKPAHFCLA